MKIKFFGFINCPTVVMIGTFDPWVPFYYQVLDDMGIYAKKHNLDSAIILLDPPPPILIHGKKNWVTYEDVETRKIRILNRGVNAVGVMDFTKEDLKGNAFTFLNFIRKIIPIRELWLGQNQSLGSGPLGSIPAISNYCIKSNTGLTLIQDGQLKQKGSEIRNWMARGLLHKALEFTEQRPIWKRPKYADNLFLELSWGEGEYDASYIQSPSNQKIIGDVKVHLIKEKNREGFYWPNKNMEWISFNRGPFDFN